MSTPKTSIIWFRRDLRINDHPALLAAIESSDQVIPLFILDKQQITEAGSKLLAYMGQSLRRLDESLGNKLHIIEGDQVEVLSTLIKSMVLNRFIFRQSMKDTVQLAMHESKLPELP